MLVQPMTSEPATTPSTTSVPSATAHLPTPPATSSGSISSKQPKVSPRDKTQTHEAPTDDQAKKAKKAKMDIRRSANATKQRYLKAKAVHDTIMHGIECEDNYAWARTESTMSPLQKAYTEVSEKFIKDSFYKCFVLNEAADIKKKFDSDFVVEKLKEFMADVDQSLKGLEREQLRFSRMHAARGD